MNEKTLKFCPCCNGIAILDESEAQIRCIDCGLTMDITKCFSIGGSWKEAVEEAVTKWNTRKTMERIIERFEEKIKLHQKQSIDERLEASEQFAQVRQKNCFVNALKIVKEEGGIE